MPEIIDSLIIEIGLDPTKMTEGEKTAVLALGRTKDEAKKAGDAAESATARTRRAINQAARASNESRKNEAQGFAGLAKAMQGTAKTAEQVAAQKRKREATEAAQARRDARQRINMGDEAARRVQAGRAAQARLAQQARIANAQQAQAAVKLATVEAQNKGAVEKARIAAESKAKADADRKEREEAKKKRDEPRKAQSERESQLKRSKEMFSQARNQALAFLAVAIGAKGVESFVRSSVTEGTLLNQTSKNIGETAPELAAYRNAVAANGGSKEEATASLVGLTNQLETQKATGNSAILPYLQAIGASGANNAQQVLEQAAKFADANRADRPKVNFYLRGLGLDQGTINLMLEGLQKYHQAVEEAKKSAPTEEQTEKAKELYGAWSKFSASVKQGANDLLYGVSPALSDILNKTTEAANKFSGVRDGIIGVGTAVAAAFSIAKFIAFLRMIGLLKKSLVEVEAVEAAETVAAETAGGATAAGVAGVVGAAGLVAATAVLGGDAGPNGNGPTDEQRKEYKAKYDALPEDQKFWPSLKRAIFGGKAASESGGNAGAAKPPSPDKLAGEKTDIDQLTKLGWTPEQAAGIEANIQSESGGNAGAVGDGGAAYGIAQWHSDRQKAFAEWAGHDIRQSTRAEQVAFIDYEMRHGKEQAAGRELSQATDAGTAGAIVSQKYERPAATDQEARRRAALAAVIYGNTGGAGTAIAATPYQPDPAMNVGAGTIAASNVSNDNRANTSTSTSETNIGSITIQTQATDAKGIAGDIRGTLKGGLTAQANSGLS